MIPLHHQFRVDLPLDQTWALLTDLPKVAQCMPGANLNDVVDGEYRGGLATRIGPISAKYQGVAVFREQDEVARRAVIEARGREEKGNGSASATITTHLKPDDEGTLVEVSTELAITGRAAQFGRSLLAEVSNSIVDQFVARLQAMASGETTGAAAGPASSSNGTASPTGTGRQTRPEPTTAAAGGELEELDVLSTVVAPLLRRAATPAIVAMIAGAVGVLVGRRSCRSTGRSIPFTYVLPYPGTTPESTPWAR